MRTLIAVTAALTLGLTGCGSSSTSDEDGGVGKFDAQLHCENAAKERSEDPGGVKFSGQTETVFEEVDGGWDVQGWVDNPNGTGGFIRFDYSCQVTPADGDQVNVKLDITER